ncbi:MAG: sirohydrochlorin cobaltochelatase, partial [Selenomonadaceae bacterium]
VLRRLKGNKNVSAVILMPLLLNAGDHVLNDMAGTKPASWKSQLLQAGYQVTVYMHGLGENLAVQRIYLQHIQDAIEGENSLTIK